MAISTLNPHTAAPPDLETLDSLVALFAQTGHPISKSTLRRLLKEAGVTAHRSRLDRKDRFRNTEALLVHRDYVNGVRKPPS